MKIVSNREECETMIGGLKDSILNAFSFKKLLNTHYSPDAYLFCVEGEDLMPLVVKNGKVTTFGGTRHNAANKLPENARLINAALDYICDNSHALQMVSLKNDPFRFLASRHRSFDVPYKVEWHFCKIHQYQEDDLMEGLSGKKLWSWKRILRNKSLYQAATISFEEFEEKFPAIMQAHNAYFEGREKGSVWKDSEILLLEILRHFNQSHNLEIRTISKDGILHAIYTLVHSKNEMIYYFGGSLMQGDHYISKVMYLDLLQNAREIAVTHGIMDLNGLAGAFTNKPAFRFSPSPLYAIVNDPEWKTMPDPDLEPGLYRQVYGRNFGCFEKENVD